MVDNLYKDKVAKMIAKAKKKGLVKTYAQFCETKSSKEYALTKEEAHYYISKNKGEIK